MSENSLNLAPAWADLNPVEIHWGSGSLARLPDVLPKGAILLLGSPSMERNGYDRQVATLLGPARQVSTFTHVTANPELAAFADLRQRFSETDWAGILALGGGSVIDTAKVLSVALPLGDSFSLVGHLLSKANLPPVRPIPVFAIPTTAGTGSEVTSFATVWESPARRKHSLSGPELYPKCAVVDPDLTLSLPWDVTIATGLDALSQALESVWNINATPETLKVANRAARLSWEALHELSDGYLTPPLRSRLMKASLLAGLAISQTRTALAHSMSYPITAHFGVPHGLACSFMLPALMSYNATSDDGRLQALAQTLGYTGVAECWRSLARLLFSLNLPVLLSNWVPDYSALKLLVPEMLTPGRADNNLRPASTADVAGLLDAAHAHLELKFD